MNALRRHRELIFFVTLVVTFLAGLRLLTSEVGDAARGAAFLLEVLVSMAAVMLFHDCLHGSAYRSSRANRIIGRLVGAAYFWPYAFLRWSHLQHHRNVGLVDGDTELLHPMADDAVRRPFGASLARLGRSPLGPLLYAPLMQAIEFCHWIAGGSRTQRRQRLRELGVDVGMMVVVWVPLDAWLFSRHALVSGFLLGVFAPSLVALLIVHTAMWPLHYGMASGRLVDTSRVARIFMTARTFDPGPLARWAFANQTLHVEHHLWPNVSRWDLQQVSRERAPEVDALARQYGLPVMRHRSYGDFYGWAKAKLGVYSQVADKAGLLRANEHWLASSRDAQATDPLSWLRWPIAVVVVMQFCRYTLGSHDTLNPALFYAPIGIYSSALLWRAFKPWDAAKFALVALATSSAAEWFGQTHGLFGVRYVYAGAEVWGAAIHALLPLAVPVMWLTFMVPAWIGAAVMVRAVDLRLSAFTLALLRAFLAAVLMLAWDLVLDPTSVHAGYWSWHDVDSTLNGIPPENYSAWILGSFGTFIIFELFSGFRPKPPMGPSSAWRLPFLAVGLAHLASPLSWQVTTAALALVSLALWFRGEHTDVVPGKIQRPTECALG